MEKLLRDLNIYAHSFVMCNLTFTYDGNRLRVEGNDIGPYVAESIVISNRFGFIGHLIKNDRISITKLVEIKNEEESMLVDMDPLERKHY